MVKSNNNILKMWAFFVVLWLGASTAGSVENNGTTWAILVAGSKGWDNYRHQADVCHAYQILKKGGLKDENIIVFMYDDIACNSKNSRPGIVINRPNGTDVYFGVPKDYTGDDVNVENFLAVVLGEKQKLKGGSGKICRSNSHDRVFIYYADHGRPGYLGMPTGCELQADELIKSLDAKHKACGYKEMVIYVEACESGSLFEAATTWLENMNIYAMTASNAYQSSYAVYFDDSMNTHLGDLYSVSWMEDSETHNRKEVTMRQQYNIVKDRTSFSHVMEYGNKSMGGEYLYLYQGFDSDFGNNQNQGIAAPRGESQCSSLIVDKGGRLSPCLYFTMLYFLLVVYFLFETS